MSLRGGEEVSGKAVRIVTGEAVSGFQVPSLFRLVADVEPSTLSEWVYAYSRTHFSPKSGPGSHFKKIDGFLQNRQQNPPMSSILTNPLIL